MNLSVLTSIAGSEEKSEEFLRSICDGKSIGRVRMNFFKCYSCRREWLIRKDTILEDLKVPSQKSGF
jgi:transposase